MTVTNKGIGEQINLAAVLNTKLESPLLQSEMGLDVQASTINQAVRWNEFSLRHNNDGTLKAGVIINYKKTTVSNPSATVGTFGTVVDLLPATNYSALNPMAVDVVFGGTFGAETVTADITVTYSDATTATVTKTATAIGTTAFTNSDLMALIKDGVYINKISVKSKSSIASTTATVTFDHYGFYL